MGQVLRFQVKLLVDGLRDLVMSPISLAAALIGLVAHPDRPGRLFEQVLDFGRQTEDWINLFGRPQEEPGIDELFGKLERQLESQYDSGGVTRAAKHTVDASLDRLHRAIDRVKAQRGSGEGGGEKKADGEDEAGSGGGPDPR